jgi:hypothetical protein
MKNELSPLNSHGNGSAQQIIISILSNVVDDKDQSLSLRRLLTQFASYFSYTYVNMYTMHLDSDYFSSRLPHSTPSLFHR